MKKIRAIFHRKPKHADFSKTIKDMKKQIWYLETSPRKCFRHEVCWKSNVFCKTWKNGQDYNIFFDTVSKKKNQLIDMKLKLCGNNYHNSPQIPAYSPALILSLSYSRLHETMFQNGRWAKKFELFLGRPCRGLLRIYQ